MAIGGLGLTQAYDMPLYDAFAGVGFSGLLASMGLHNCLYQDETAHETSQWHA
jgi:hypothetical protein